MISGFTSAATGAMLLGWSGGGFIGVGDQYLFLTVAAVAAQFFIHLTFIRPSSFISEVTNFSQEFCL